jgi:hypothetical protein
MEKRDHGLSLLGDSLKLDKAVIIKQDDPLREDVAGI